MTAPGDATSVGEIIGYLRLDRSDWDHGLDEAEARARRLGETDPRIRIRVEDNGAQARMAALEAELARLRMRLDETDRANRRTDQSSRQASRGMGTLLSTVLLLGPALIPLAAVLGGAFAGALPTIAAATLAVFGIRDAWKSGALAGTDFASQVGVMKGELSQLKQIAAAGVLPGLTSAMVGLQPLFTLVNQDVAIFSGQLGQIVAAVAPALVQILTDLQPLFTTLGSVLVSGANHLAQWAENGQGVTGFVNYVVAELPTVLHTLGEVIGAIGHLAAALAPIGHVALVSIGIIAEILQKIPVNVLTGLAAAALAAFAAFQVLKGAVLIMRLVSTAMATMAASTGAMLGGIGLLVGLIGIFAFAMGNSGDRTEQASAAMQTYADSVAKSTYALSQLNQQQTLNNLKSSGAISILDGLHASNKALGVSVDDLVAGVNGSDAQFGKLSKTLSGTGVIGKQLALQLGDMHTGLQRQIVVTKAAQAAQDQLNQKFTAADSAALNMATRLGTTKDAYLAAQQAAKKNTDQAAQQTLQYQLENDAASLLAQTIEKLAGKTASVLEAQTSARQASLQVTEAFKGNGTAIRGGTKDAVAHQQALQGVYRADLQLADAIGKRTGSSKAAVRSIRDSKAALEDQLRTQHKLTPAVQAYIDKLYDLKDLKVPPTKLDVDKAAARAKIKALQDQITAIKQGKVPGVDADTRKGRQQIKDLQQAIDDLHNKTLTVTITQLYKTTHGPGSTTYNEQVPGFTGADGGTVPGAPSDVDTVPAMLARGEEVINARQASKHRGLLKAINAGRDGFASGGTVGAVNHAGSVISGINSTRDTPTLNARWTTILARLAAAVVAIREAGQAGASKSDLSKLNRQYESELTDVIKAQRTLVHGITATDIPALTRALGKSADDVQSAEQALIAHTRQAGASAKAIDRLSKEGAELTRTARLRDSVAERLAQDKANRANEADSVKSSILGGFDITRPGGDGVLATLQAQVANASALLANEKTLQNRGLDKNFIAQLAEKGPQDAASAIQELLSYTPGQLKALNSARGQLSSLGGQLGSLAGNALYGGQIATDQASLTRLNGQMDRLARAMEKQARVNVRVYIGEKEIRHVVQSEIAAQVRDSRKR